jgi:hypothetical protein
MRQIVFTSNEIVKIKYITKNISDVEVIVIDKKNNKLIKKEI